MKNTCSYCRKPYGSYADIYGWRVKEFEALFGICLGPGVHACCWDCVDSNRILISTGIRAWRRR